MSTNLSLSESVEGGVSKIFEEGHPFSPKYLSNPKPQPIQNQSSQKDPSTNKTWYIWNRSLHVLTSNGRAAEQLHCTAFVNFLHVHCRNGNVPCDYPRVRKLTTRLRSKLAFAQIKPQIWFSIPLTHKHGHPNAFFCAKHQAQGKAHGHHSSQAINQ
jgi:hypothetical protein